MHTHINQIWNILNQFYIISNTHAHCTFNNCYNDNWDVAKRKTGKLYIENLMNSRVYSTITFCVSLIKSIYKIGLIAIDYLLNYYFFPSFQFAQYISNYIIIWNIHDFSHWKLDVIWITLMQPSSLSSYMIV